MPIQVTCTGCGVSLATPDSSAGKRAKCPKCGGAIQIPEASQQDEIFDAESSLFSDRGGDQLSANEMTSGAAADERVPCRACGEMIMRGAIKCRFCGEVLDKSLKGLLNTSGNVNDPAWLKVRSGLSTIYNCIGILFGTGMLIAIIGGIMGAVNADQRGGEPPAAFMIVIGIGGLVIFGAAIGMLVGQVRCTNVPQESGAHGFAVGAILCLVGNIFLSMAGGATKIQALSGMGSLLSLVGWILFILFIKRAAAYLNDHELASSAGKFLLFCVAMFVGAIALGVLSAVGGPVVLIILGLGVMVGGLAGLVWYLRLVRGLMTTIDNALETRRSTAVTY